jgi:predicted outer membrane repeat protein
MHSGPLPADTAPGLGGDVLIIAGSTVTIDHASFTNNIAGSSGGAINSDRNTDLGIVGSAFTGNSAQGLFAGGASGFGGAIQSEGNLSLTGSTLTGNAAAEAGGAMATKSVPCAVRHHVSGNRPLRRRHRRRRR